MEYNEKLRVFLYYFVGLVICVLTMFIVLNLKSFDLTIPYVYTGDGLSTSLFIKGMIKDGWYNSISGVGAPYGLEMYDYPLGGDNLQYLIMKVISIFTNNYVVVMNLYYLLTYPLVFISTMVACRLMRIEYTASILCSLLFTFLPYHLIRTGHLFLLGYYIVPLVTVIFIWLIKEEELLVNNKSKKLKIIINKKTIASVIICLLIGSTGAYYAFFSCFFFFIIILFKLFSVKKISSIITPIFFVIVIAGTLVINISPSLLYKLNNGSNPEVSARNFEATETFGLKITQLLLPVTNHRISFLAKGKEHYNNSAPLVNENDTASLGVIGSVGFILLLFYYLFYNKKKLIYNGLGLLNISAVLLGTIGGLGTLFAIIVSAQIRSYNRLSIFIALFSFIFLSIAITNYYNEKINKSNNKKILYTIFLCLLAVIGLFDQTRNSLVPSSIIKAQYDNDNSFIKKIESTVPAGSMIYQLPYVPFPEPGPVKNIGAYDLLKGYLHSDNLRWSSGGMKGRKGDLLQKELVKLPISKTLEFLSIIGYSGIYIDSNGYSKEYLDQIKKTLSNLTSQEPVYSQDKRLLFYDLTEYNKKFLLSLSQSQKEDLKHQLSELSQEKKISLNGNYNWEFVMNRTGYKVIQMNALEDLPVDQNKINLSIGNNVFSFNDSFSSPYQFSYRHWENPKHLVVSLPNSLTGWDNSKIPSVEEVKAYSNKFPITLNYFSESPKKPGEIYFKE